MHFGENHYMKKEKINYDDDVFDISEEYFNSKGLTKNYETEEYFPQENSKPPHY